MKKIRLDLDRLDVESFEPAGRDGYAAGTVRGHSYLSREWGPCSGEPSQHCLQTDWHWNTCGVSCEAACFPTGEVPQCVN